MRALFVGLGSIGRRHLTNLTDLCRRKGTALEVTALRATQRPLPEDTAVMVHQQIFSIDECEAYDAAFVTNPTHLHAPILGGLSGRIGTFFIEKPLFECTNYSLDALGLGCEQKAYVAAPMRWCGVYRALRKRLENLPVYSVRAICSSYLPGWRPGADYRTVYSAHREMGGGVALDLIHEWDYLADLFGLPQESRSFAGRYSHLEIDADDLAIYIAKYANFLCELHLDYFGRAYRRFVDIFTKDGTLQADFGTGLLTLPNGTTENHEEPLNRRYEREMEYFVDYALHGAGASVNSPQNALEVLKIALGD